MPLYTPIQIEAALARANGQTLTAIKSAALAAQTPEVRGPTRNFGSNQNVAYKNKTGHAYAHVATFSEGSIDLVVKGMAVKQAAEKSRWSDRRTCIGATTEVMNSVDGQSKVQKFSTANPPAGPERIQRVALVGDFYGFMSGSTELRKISTGTTCFFITAGVLFVTTSYPEDFVAGPLGLIQDEDLDLSALFG
jgi:hypothetical protein